MTSINIFYQAEGMRDFEHIEVADDATFGTVKAAIIEKHGLAPDVLIFLEDAEEAIVEMVIVGEHARSGGVKVHLHRCHHVEVAVTFNGETVHDRFSPGTTVARVKRWAAIDKFKMTEEEASEHVLQLAGSQDRPAPGTHLGALASCPDCRVAFDLVPDQRINGACDEEAA